MEEHLADLCYHIRQQTEMAEAGACCVLLCGDNPGQINRPGAEK